MVRGVLIVLLLGLGFTTSAQHPDFWNADYTKADSIAEVYTGIPLKNPDMLAENLTATLTSDTEKFRAIFRWITTNIEYDFKLYTQRRQKERKLKNKRQKLERWRSRFNKNVYAQMIRNKSTICSGYSFLLEYMCNHVGIKCETIEGYGRSEDYKIGGGEINHAWNVVYLDNKWYLCDPTWASGSIHWRTNRFRKKFDPTYFLADPALFIANHYPKDPSWILLFEKPTLNQFINAPIKSTGFIKHKINIYTPAKGVIRTKRGDPTEFKFTANTPEVLNSVRLEYWKKVSYHYDYPIQKNNQGEYFFSHQFSEKGNYRVYIYVNSDCTFIYEINVI